MSKLTSKNKKEILKIEEQELWELEQSVITSNKFIDNVMLPLLEEFELNNDDEHYVEGMATHGLFIALIQKMAEMGYTERELKKEVKTYLSPSIGETLH